MTIKQALEELAEKMKQLVKDRIEMYGINWRTGTNTLQGSDLEDSIVIEPYNYGVRLRINAYWEFVSLGWQRTGNFPNTFHLFVENIEKWVRKKGIRFPDRTESQVVWSVVNTIWNYGIAARPFMVYSESGDLTEMIPELEAYIDRWFDMLFEAIINDLDKYFNER